MIPSSYRLHGRLDVKCFEQSLEELIRRHESLRTTFPLHTDQPVQIIHPVRSYCLPVIDLQKVREDEQTHVVQQLAEQEAQHSCNLTRGPLMRTYLLRLKAQEHVLLLTLHHIITDGWSNGVLVRELTTLYHANISGQPSPLASLPIQYADYALWQREWLQGEVLETQLAYWRKQLAGITSLKLPTDRPRPSTQSQRGATYSFALSANMSEVLVNLSFQENVTLFMMLLAAFQALLYCYSQQDDVVVGTDVANRHRVEIEGLVGFFVNQLVLRANLSGNPTFRELLKQVRTVTLEAYAHQDLPFEKLVEALRPKRSMQYAPLFQIKILFHNAFTETLRTQDEVLLPGVAVSQQSLSTGTTQIDLLLRLSQTPRGLVGAFTYSTDLFDAATIERMADHFVKLLESISANPDARLSTLEIIIDEEKEQKSMKQEERLKNAIAQFKRVQPRPISLQQDQLIQTEYLSPEEHLPLVIRPQRVELDLVEWVESNQSFIEAELCKHGALLFRDFHISSPVEFERFALAL
ncbi:MAG TPA: condensation domain-containing protein, partial [Ktedonobacteraceae bacterium]|nr:condensation domain-containing protein [Ktedonobacteraceae bacterium]